MSDALLRIGERVLRGCAALTAAPPEPFMPRAFADVTADPALLLTGVWAAALPPPAAFSPHAGAARDDEPAFPPLFGDERVHGTNDTPQRTRRTIASAARPDAATGAERTGAASGTSAASALHRDAPPNRVTAAQPLPSPAPRRPLWMAAEPPSSGRDAGASAANTGTGTRAPAASAGARRAPVALVRAVPRSADIPGSSASPAGTAGAGELAHLAGAVSPPATSRSSPRPATPRIASVPSRSESLAPPPHRSAPATGTRMVRGAAGLASVLSSHVTSRGEPPAVTAPLAPQPPVGISSLAPRPASTGTPSPLPLAPAPAALAAPHPLAPVAHAGPAPDSADAGDLTTAATPATQPGPLTAADRVDADAVYDALESRLRAEFLRTYGSYGA